MGYSPWGQKESDMTEHACTFLVIFQGFSTLVQQQSLLGVGFLFLFLFFFVNLNSYLIISFFFF